MTSHQITQIIDYRAFKDSPLVVELIETHISWVILTENFAFKIKKPLKYSFLDFSTLEKRKYYCEQEVLLNQRLAKDIYLKVVPIRLNREVPFIDALKGEIIGYAVKMKRLNNDREMNKHGFRVPTKTSVAWKIDGEEFVYAKFLVTDIDFIPKKNLTP